MPDYSYECTKAVCCEELVLAAPNTEGRILLCNLEFVDEHGHALAPVRNAIVVVDGGRADICHYSENLLREDATTQEWERVEALCKNNPNYGVYNCEKLAAMLS